MHEAWREPGACGSALEGPGCVVHVCGVHARPCALSTVAPPLRPPQGYGTLLMLEAERIARCEHRSAKLAVISGVGTRHYYRKLG